MTVTTMLVTPTRPPTAAPILSTRVSLVPGLPTPLSRQHPALLLVQHTGDSYRFPCSSPALKALESSSRRALQGLVFLVGNGLGLALALYKCQAMGLLPTRPSDWLAFVAPPQVCLDAMESPHHPHYPRHWGAPWPGHWVPPLTSFSLSFLAADGVHWGGTDPVT